MAEKPRPPPGVAFRDLNVFGLGSEDEYQHTAASYLLIVPRFIARLLRQQATPRRHILHGLCGEIQHGEMLLVLGRPGSGCSTFLKSLAGETSGLHIDPSSRLVYNALPAPEGKNRPKGNAIYLSELDVHVPELTLGQTLEFAAATQNNSDSRNVGRNIATSFKLDAAYNSPVGNAMIRGISGGEKRRTSIAEVFISESSLQCWDNSTRGLDSSTALSFVQLLRRSTNEKQATVMMSIYQASNAIYESFDTVMLLYEGYQIYFGPAELAVKYFFDLGFEKPARATTADFLTSITHPAERRIRKGYEDRVPRSVEALTAAWTRSDIAQGLLKQDYSHQDAKRNTEKTIFQDNAYKISTRSQIGLNIQRGFQRLRNQYVPPVSGIIANTIISVVVGSVYYNLSEDTDAMDKRAVLLFFSLMINAYAPAFDGFALWAQRPIVEKQHRYAFYRPFTDSIASIICDLPNKVATVVMFNVPLYFMTNLRRSASAFFVYLVFMIVTVLTMSMFFRTVASLCKTIEQSMIPSSMIILIFSAYTGYIIPVKDMVPWLAWLRRLNPIAFCYESLMINEFADRIFSCARIIPSGGSYSKDDKSGKICAVIGAGPGQIDIDGSVFIARKYSYHADHLWRNLGILLAMLIILCGTHLIAIECVPSQRSRGEVLLYQRKSKKRPITVEDEEIGRHDGNSVTVSPHDKTFETVDVETSHSIGTRPQLHQRNLPVFHWSGLDYSIKIKQNSRQILQKVEGWVRPGSLTALMGVTGAGKTSLLDCLAHRNVMGKVRGDILLGSEVPDANFQRKVGYVQQEDIHLATTTVREALDFSARLRRPNDDYRVRLAQVQNILNLLEMTSYADAVVGIPGEGLNVEQRKRLSIAVEMVAKPELLLFLDEPTSGLDSQTAWSICMLLRKLADSGQAIIITIHQPSSQLFELFDRLLLLDNHGRLAYFGDIGNKASTVIEYFEKNGSGKCDPSNNPAEWILNVTNAPEDDRSALRYQPSPWHEIWVESVERQEVTRLIATFKTSSTTANTTTVLPKGRSYAASIPTQLWVVTRRQFQDYWRDPVYLYGKLALCALTTLLNGISFFNARLDIQGITNIFFSVFLFTQLFSTVNQQVIPRLSAGRSLFEARERRSKSYSWTVFIAANVVVELFWQTIASGLVFVTWYYPTGIWRNHDPTFPETERGGLAFGVIWLFCLWISTFSQVVGVGIDHAETAVQIATLFFWLSLVFCGVLVAPNDLPRFWRFVYRASPLTYFIDGAVVSGLANMEIRCSEVEMLHIQPPVGSTCGEYLNAWISTAGGYLATPAASHDCEYCPVSGTNILLSTYGIDVQSRWHYFAYLTVYIVFNVIATFGIYWIARERKSRKSVSSQ